MLRKSTLEESIRREKAWFELDIRNYQNALDIFEEGIFHGDIRCLSGKAIVKREAGLEIDEYFQDLLEGARLGDPFAVVEAHGLAKEQANKSHQEEIKNLFDAMKISGNEEFHFAMFRRLKDSDLEEALCNLHLAVRLDAPENGYMLARVILFACIDKDIKKSLCKASKKSDAKRIAKLDFDLSSVSNLDWSEILPYSKNETWNAIKEFAGIDKEGNIPANALEIYFTLLGQHASHWMDEFQDVLTDHFARYPQSDPQSLLANPGRLTSLATIAKEFGNQRTRRLLEESLEKLDLLDGYLKATSETESIFDDFDDDEYLTDEPIKSVTRTAEQIKEDEAFSQKKEELDEQIEEAIQGVRDGEVSWKVVIKLFKKYQALSEEDLGESWLYEEQLTQLVNDNDDIFYKPGENAIKDPKFFAALKDFISVGGAPELTMASSKYCPKEIVLEIMSSDYAPMDDSLSVQQVVAEMQSDVDYFKAIIEQGDDDRALITLSARTDLPLDLVERLAQMQIYSLREFGEFGEYRLSHLANITGRNDVTAGILKKIVERANTVMAGGTDPSIHNVDMALEIEKVATKRLKTLS